MRSNTAKCTERCWDGAQDGLLRATNQPKCTSGLVQYGLKLVRIFLVHVLWVLKWVWIMGLALEALWAC